MFRSCVFSRKVGFGGDRLRFCLQKPSPKCALVCVVLPWRQKEISAEPKA